MINEATHDKYDGKAIFIVGPPAAGKSTLVKKIVDTFHFKLLDSDTIFEKLMSKYNLSLKMDTLKGDDVDKKYDLLDTAYDKNKKRAYQLMKNRIPIILSRTGRLVDDIVKDKIKAEKNGYDCLLIIVDVDEDVAVKRNAERYRSVDTAFVKSSNKEFKRNIQTLKYNFKDMMYINTTKLTDEELKGYEKQIRKWAEK
jgi:dephospho-CoA kinase